MRHAPGGLFAAGIVLVAIATLAFAPPAHAARDPFAPPGTQLVRVEILHRGMVDQLLALGLRPEEGGRDYLTFRVTPSELDALRAGRFPMSVIEDETGADSQPDPMSPAFTSYAQLTADLQALAAAYPTLTELRSWGTSVGGRSIWGLKISGNAAIEEVEPEVRIVGAHHGNERMSVEVVKTMAHYLLENYGTNPTVTALVNGRETWLVPMVNPDGVEAVSRYNSHGVDLNRNYGYMWEAGGGYGSSGFSEPETRAVRELSTANWFSLGLSFHCSGDVVNSIWNYTPHYTEDDAAVWVLSTGYAAFNGYWAVRGWYWYETHGDLNDWSYGARSTLDWTIEVASSGESTVWNKNRDAILYVIGAAGWGVHGTVTDALTGVPLRARVTVNGIDWPAFTDPTLGDYHKVLLAGAYTLRVSANGYTDLVVPGVVVPASGGVTVNAALMPGGMRALDRVEIANVADPGNNYANYTLTPAMLGAPDGVGASIGRSGNAVMDFGPGSEARDIEGADLRVVESTEDAAGERYTLYVGNSYLGPWTSLGMGTGTTAFDLAGSGLLMARYLRIVDDGDGVASDPYAGFDLDAIQSYGAAVTAVAGGEIPATWPGAAAIILAPPAPNPFDAAHGAMVTLAASLAHGGDARLDILDARGRLIITLAAGVLPSGVTHVAWPGRDRDGSEVPAGIYFVRLSSGGEATSRKLLVVR